VRRATRSRGESGTGVTSSTTGAQSASETLLFAAGRPVLVAETFEIAGVATA
jgi:hypothetical protein